MNSMLSEISHYKKTNSVSVHLYEVPRAVRYIEAENTIVFSLGWKDGDGVLFNGYTVIVL